MPELGIPPTARIRVLPPEVGSSRCDDQCRVQRRNRGRRPYRRQVTPRSFRLFPQAGTSQRDERHHSEKSVSGSAPYPAPTILQNRDNCGLRSA